MSWFLQIAYLAFHASVKWVLILIVTVGVVVGALFAAGIFSGDSTPAPVVQALVADPTPTPPATLAPTAVPPTSYPSPSPTPRTRTVISPTPTPIPVPNPEASWEIEVPVRIASARHVGSLEFVLKYDSDTLQFSQIDTSQLANDAVMEASSLEPGSLWVGMIDVNGFSGDGHIAVVTFKVVEGSDLNSTLTLEDIVGYDANTLVDLLINASPGGFTRQDWSVDPPTLSVAN
jgi:hypothetical protein